MYAVHTVCHKRPAYVAKMKGEPNPAVQGGFMVPLIISHRGLIEQRPNRTAAVHHIQVIRKLTPECFIMEVVDLKGFLNALNFTLILVKLYLL